MGGTTSVGTDTPLCAEAGHGEGAVDVEERLGCDASRRGSAWIALVSGLALCATALGLLLALGLDISPHRFLRNDVLFRGADSIDAFYTYSTMDPSPFSVALPADLFVRDRLLSGELPLWDRMQGGGYSMISQGNLGVLFPLRWLASLFPASHTHAALMLLTLYLCFAGAFLWLLALDLSVLSAVLGAGLFAGSGSVLGQLPFDGAAVFLFLPWLLLAWWRWRARPGYGRFATLVLLFALSFTSGHHMLLASVFLAVAVVAMADFIAGNRDARVPLGLAGTAIWGALCAAVVLLPFVLHLGTAWSYKTETGQGLTFEVPGFSGWLTGLWQMVFDADAPFLDTPGRYRHFGIPAVALALLGAVVCRARSLGFVAPALILAFLLSLPGPWMGFLSELLPLSFIRNIYLYVILTAVVATAAAVGFDWLRERLRDKVPAALWPAAVVLLVGSAFLRGLPFFQPVPVATIPLSEPYQLLLGDPDRFRITSLGGQSHLPNISHLTGLEDLRVISVAHNARYHAWFELVDPQVLEKSFPTARVTPVLGSPLVGAFNVKYVVVGKIPHHAFVTQIRPGDIFGAWSPVRAQGDDLTLIYEDPRLQILRVGDSFRPRLFRPDEVHAVAPGAKAAAAWLRTHPEALARGAVVVEAPIALHEALEATSPAAHRAELEYPSHAGVRIRIDSQTPGLLVLNDSFEAGWEAILDGVATEILPVNVIARGVWVPAGTHEVRMRYRPPGLAPGAALSAAALGALGCGAWFVRSRRHAPSRDA